MSYIVIAAASPVIAGLTILLRRAWKDHVRLNARIDAANRDNHEGEPWTT